MNAMVTDAYGNPVENGTVVYFTVDDDDFSDGTINPRPGQDVCPSGVTGTATDGSSCVGATTAMAGVARTLLTWPSALTWTDYYLFAETLGGTVTDLYGGVYPAIEGVTIDVSITPPSVQAGTTGIV